MCESGSTAPLPIAEMRSAATIALERGYDPRQVVTDGSVVGSGGAFYLLLATG